MCARPCTCSVFVSVSTCFCPCLSPCVCLCFVSVSAYVSTYVCFSPPSLSLPLLLVCLCRCLWPCASVRVPGCLWALVCAVFICAVLWQCPITCRQSGQSGKELDTRLRQELVKFHILFFLLFYRSYRYNVDEFVFLAISVQFRPQFFFLSHFTAFVVPFERLDRCHF